MSLRRFPRSLFSDVRASFRKVLQGGDELFQPLHPHHLTFPADLGVPRHALLRRLMGHAVGKLLVSMPVFAENLNDLALGRVDIVRHASATVSGEVQRIVVSADVPQRGQERLQRQFRLTRPGPTGKCALKRAEPLLAGGINDKRRPAVTEPGVALFVGVLAGPRAVERSLSRSVGFDSKIAAAKLACQHNPRAVRCSLMGARPVALSAPYRAKLRRVLTVSPDLKGITTPLTDQGDFGLNGPGHSYTIHQSPESAFFSLQGAHQRFQQRCKYLPKTALFPKSAVQKTVRR